LGPRRKPLQNILWLIGERVARSGVTVIVLGLVARHLSPTGFGELNLAIAIVLMGTVLANVGLEGIVVRELVKRPEDAGRILGTAFRLRLFGGIATFGLFAIAALLGGAGSEAHLVGIIAVGLVFQPAEVIDLWFQRHLESRRTALVRLLAVLLSSILKLFLIVINAQVVAFAWAQAAESLLFALGLGWAYRSGPRKSGAWAWDPARARELWRQGAPLAISALAVAFAMRLDQFLVRSWLGESATGIYYAATRLTEFALFAGATLAISLFPGLAQSHDGTTEGYHQALQELFDALSALGWIVGIGFTVLAPVGINLLFGTAYAGAVPILIIQGWAALFALSATARWQYIILSAPPAYNLVAAIVHIGVMLVAGGWLIPRLGLPGAALTWLVATACSGYLTTLLLPGLRLCAGIQTRALLIPFAPARWGRLIRQFVRD